MVPLCAEEYLPGDGRVAHPPAVSEGIPTEFEEVSAKHPGGRE